MIWLTWRQHRGEGLVVCAALVLAGVYLLITGRVMADALQQSGLGTCLAHHPADVPACGELVGEFVQQFGPFIPFAAALLIAPILLGAIVGGPLVAREYEQRTHLLVWMQSVTRSRWLAVKLALVLGAGALVGGALIAMLTRWYVPYAQLIGSFNPVAFDFSGPVLIASTVLAVALGVFAGALTRHTVAAILLTLALILAVRLPVEFVLRPNYQPQVVVTWPLSQGPDAPITLGTQDWQIASGFLDAQGNRVNYVRCTSAAVQTPMQCMQSAGYRGFYLAYQPAGRFWTFQWIESAIYLAIAALAVAASAWLVRRRLA